MPPQPERSRTVKNVATNFLINYILFFS